MAESIAGYAEITPEQQKRAEDFFAKAAAVAGTGNYDYAIDMYLSGLKIDPDAVTYHKLLRDISFQRKATGGKALGMMQAMGLKRSSKDDRENMLNAEKLLAYDPGNVDNMMAVFLTAYKAGFYDTVLWIGPVTQRGIVDSKPDFKKFITLRDTYGQLAAKTNRPDIWKLSIEACNYALQMKPDDMDLQKALRDLSAQHAMVEGKYAEEGNFRKSVRNADEQDKLMQGDADIRNVDMLGRLIKEAEDEYKADPNEIGKLMKLVDIYAKTEDAEYENKAIELLDEWHKKTKAYRFKQRTGDIIMSQMSRQERMFLNLYRANPADAAAKKDYLDFHKERLERELELYQENSINYPTDSAMKFGVARRLFELGRFDEAIPAFQQTRNDPKYRTDSSVLLGRAFLEADYIDESVETLKAVIDGFEAKNDDRFTDMLYWWGRALEKQGDKPTAIKAYSQVAQQQFNFKDVQLRIKALRAAAAAT